MKRKLKVNDFFCGCGGMGIAFKNAGYEIAGAWDFDKYAVESYRANVGDHVQKADIKELHQADIPQADVWAFGFPCQDLSVAGKQRGMILKCEDCGEEIEINPEEYTGNTICPKCSSNNFKAASRSGNWKVGNYRFGYAQSPKAIEAVRKNTKAACLEKSRKDKESEE